MSEPPKKRGPVLVEIDAPPRAPLPPRGPAPRDPQPVPPPRMGPGAEARVEGGPAPSPADAPPIDDGPTGLPQPRAMELVTRLAGAEPPFAVKLFVQAGAALLTFLLSIAALSFIDDLMTRYPVLGWIGVALFALFTLATLILAFREYRAFARLRRIDSIHREAGAALARGDLHGARTVADALAGIYAERPETARARQRLAEARADSYDAQTLLSVAEAELLAPLDQLARREIEAAARTVAAATALIPLALADVAAALFANLRMIRRMAEIYGGRAGAVGGWRLARTVMTHLIATGAVAAGDDLIHTMAGGGALAKVSRRFGEGVVNGALTARVGIAAMEVCRPLPFIHQPRPRVANLLSRGLAGLFGRE